jgi:L-fuconolactonase
MSARSLRIDAHQHFWDPARFHYPWMEGAALDAVRRPFTPADLAPALSANGIDGTVLGQTLSDVTETRVFLDTARDTDFVRGVVGWVDLVDPAVGDTLDELAETYGNLLVGIRHQVHDEPDPDWLRRGEVRRGLRAVEARGLCYDVLVRTRELPAATATVAALPGLAFVLDHIAKPRIAEGWDEPWSAAIADLAALPNVHVKLSGMVTEADWGSWNADTLAPFVERVLDLFGIDRVMFGSDWPVCLLAASGYDEVIGALSAVLNRLSEAERDKVFGGTACTFYGITDTVLH